MRRQNAEIACLADTHLCYDNINHNFRFGPVQIIDDLLRQRNLVRSSFHDDGILRRNMLNTLDFQKRADRSNHVLKICVEFLALGRRVLRDENGVRRHRTPEGSRLHAHNVQSFPQSDVLQVNRYASPRVIRVEKNVDSSQLPQGLVDDLGVILHFQSGDGNVGELSQLHRRPGLLQALAQEVFRSWLFGFRRSLGLRLLPHHLLRPAYLLLRQVIAGIDLRGLLEQVQGFLQLTCITQLLRPMDL